MKNVFKLFGLIALVAIIGFSFAACGGDDDGGGGGGGGVNWWTWVSTSTDGGYDSTSQVAITPTSNNTGCDVSVTGTANNNGNWASQVVCDYTATVGKSYKVSWKWTADGKPFTNVTIRYAQQKDYQNDSAYQLGTNTNRLTIPVSEETREYEFTMPDNCLSNFTFQIGEDIGSFKIRDFKVVALNSSSGGGKGKLTITGIPSEYNGKFAVADGYVGESGESIFLYGGAKMEDRSDDTYYTPVAISGGKVEIPLYTSVKFNNYKAYDGNGVLYKLDVDILNDGNPTQWAGKSSFVTRRTFRSGTFVNGSLTVQWDQGN
jgi:hypothetical protein